jgi:gas vesicle protein
MGCEAFYQRVLSDRRFASEDPVGFAAGQNKYLYTNANPINYVDPTGFGPVATTACAIVVAAQSAYDTRDIWNNYTNAINNLQYQLSNVNQQIANVENDPCPDMDLLQSLYELQSDLQQEILSVSSEFAQSNAVTDEIKDTFKTEIGCGLLFFLPIP